MKQLVLVAAISSVLLSTAVSAKSDRGHQHHKPMLRGMYHSLELTAVQKDQIREIMVSAKHGSDDNEKQHRHHDKRPDFSNENAFLAAFDEKITQRQTRALTLAKARHQIYLLLDEEQRNVLADRHSNKPVRPPHNMVHEKELPPHLTDLELSDAQILAIKDIFNASKQTVKQARENLRVLRDTERSLIHAEEFDEAAWLTWFDNYTEAKRAAALNRFQTKRAINAHLSDAQQAQVAQMQAPRKHHHGRRHGA